MHKTHNLIYSFTSGSDTTIGNHSDACIAKKLKIHNFHLESMQRKAINQCLELYLFGN